MFASQVQKQALVVIQKYEDYISDLWIAETLVTTTLINVCVLYHVSTSWYPHLSSIQ